MNRITVTVFGAILSISLLTQLLPDKAFSEQENRYLQTMPKLTWSNIVSGRYTKGIETYIQDHFILRDEWMKEKTSLEQLIGKQESNGVYPSKDGWYFEIDQTINQKQLQANLNHLQEFAAWLEKQKITTSFLPIYSSYMFYEELLPKYHLNIDQRAIKQELETLFHDDRLIDSYESLANQKDQNIYFKTDHHWTQLGAYYAYETIAKQKGWEVTPISKFKEMTTNQSFFGTLYSKSPRKNQVGDDFSYYLDSKYDYTVTIPEANKISNSLYDLDALTKKDKYTAFLGGNYGITVIERSKKIQIDDAELSKNANSHEDDTTIVLFKDSYSHALAPFLAQHYDKVVLIDMRYINDSIRSYISELKPTEVMFAYNLSWFAKDTNLSKWKR